MALAIESPPTRRRSSLYRASRWLFTPVRYAGRRFYYAPRSLQILLLLILIVGGTVSGIWAMKFSSKRTRAIETTLGWREYAAALEKGDIDGMKAGLDRVLEIAPEDALAARKRHDLEVEEADPGDVELAVVLLNHHMKSNRLHEMAREAAKVRNRYPKDWRSICVLAHYAREREGVDAAAAQLEELPDPGDPEARIDVGGLLYSLQLFENTGRDAGELRGLIVRRLLPVLRGGAAAGASASVKVNLVECYLEPFSEADNREVLGNYWSNAARLMDLATDAAVDEGNIPLLVRIGKLGPRMVVALNALRIRQSATVEEERFTLLRKEIESRTQRAWDAVLAREPDRVEGHLGRIQMHYLAGDGTKVVDAIKAAAAACGERTEILEQYAQVGLRTNQPKVVIGRVWQAALRSPGDARKWVLAAKVAHAIKENSLMIEACEKARALDPNNPEIAVLLAEWNLDQGKPEAALGILGADVFKPRLHRDPAFILRQARALCESQVSVVDFLKEVETKAIEEKRPSIPLLLAALDGIYQAEPPRVEQDELIAKIARDLVLRDPNGPNAVAAQYRAATALARRSEFSTPPWTRDSAHAALQAFEPLPVALKQTTPVQLMMAKLQLKGMKDPRLAAITAGPTLEERNNPGLSPADLEVLGLILLETRRAPEAVTLLQHAVARPKAPPACWIALARALHATGKREEARVALYQPRNKLDRLSPSEDAEWTAAAKSLQQESP